MVTVTTVEWTDAQRAAVNDGAVKAYRAGRGLIELDDLRQEAWLWLYENLDDVAGWIEKDTRHTRLTDVAYHAGLLLVRDTMRQQGGSKPQDFATYSTTAVSDLLPLIFVDVPAQTGDEVNEEVKHKRSPSEGGVLLATVADVKAAFKRLPKAQRELLYHLHAPVDPLTHRDLGKRMDLSEATVRRREQRALEAIVDLLGGPRTTVKRRRKG